MGNKTTKAKAKLDTRVIKTLSLNSISLNLIEVKKGQTIELPAHKDITITNPSVIKTLGNRSVVFVNSEGEFIITYSKQFEYEG